MAQLVTDPPPSVVTICSIVAIFMPTLLFHASYCRDASLKQFASLASSGSGRGGGGDCPTLLLQYVSSYGYREIAAELARWKVLPRDSTSHTHWTICMPKMVEVLISSLYPAPRNRRCHFRCCKVPDSSNLANKAEKWACLGPLIQSQGVVFLQSCGTSVDIRYLHTFLQCCHYFARLLQSAILRGLVS